MSVARLPISDEVRWLDTWGIPCTRHDHGGLNVRVAMTLAYAVGAAVDEAFLEHLVELHDHKGRLEVRWKSEAALNTYKGLLNHAWASTTSEHEISHYVIGEDEAEIYNSHRPDRIFSILNG
ncbi:hypothetical protein [Parasphingopyxis sp.]|uniref:hypothetical protein n=1 Tax=Parasphingopyxis sp. TaxID=1920299 RepID=UPI0026344191|nr:hypothetical protein [Parasphingopyxis sp.]